MGVFHIAIVSKAATNCNRKAEVALVKIAQLRFNALMEWNLLISDLLARGWTQTQIAAEFSKPQSWVSDIRRGRYRDLKWSDGDKLIRLHKQVTRRAARHAAPGQERAHV
ncbi:hypothetical protein [Achromobacter insuavis]|uniref:hypothetical protein n=1 Tax=Achromobacter insuavis TaxID=1287735 RepID=UPI0015D1F9D2|nr:hypothetical protein [Achromobacter insuavis]